MAEIDLDAIEARANAARPGPWRMVYSGMVTDPKANFVASVGAWSGLDSDAEFIAHAREDVPALIARIRELELRMPPAPGESFWEVHIVDKLGDKIGSTGGRFATKEDAKTHVRGLFRGHELYPEYMRFVEFQGEPLALAASTDPAAEKLAATRELGE